ncbi:MAG TPA: methionine--tRNA ligase [Parcubacteria group bacterium]|jgi:methionyl-tRNA synthetase|nr:methionine--tRNA ligase [Parcubacteria group bacterium]
MSKNFYITTTLPYVNSDPHIGFATEIINADVVARYKRLRGDNVFFTTGTDEHGQKIWEASQKEGRDVKEYTDHFSSEFQKLKELLNLSNDVFIRTTDEKHIKAAQEIWKRCESKGDIYKKSYTGKYCVGCESFKTPKDLNEDGKCFIHPHLEIKNIEEENYFFKLSNYEDKLLEYLQRENSVLPEWRAVEAINFVKAGLEDFSISREKERLSWGIPVPGDQNQVMYVWFDALTNYISTLDWPEEGGNFKKYWTEGEVVQLAGKDQVRFQSIMWQAMLMSADIKNTDRVVYHGFINSGGQKMSKSLGNVISPFDLVNEFGSDSVRYLLLRHVHPFEDSDITMPRLKELYNADLANGLGNLTSRILTLSEKYLDKNEISFEKTKFEEYFAILETYNISMAVEFVWKKIGELDLFIQNTEPFKVVKTDEQKGKELILEMVRKLHEIAELLEPIMYDTHKNIKQLLLDNKKPEAPLFLRKD